jgi:PAS domain S-box-containing protein
MQPGRDRDLLVETLGDEYRVVTTTDADRLEAEFDCCVFDRLQFERVADAARSTREASDGVFLPFVLLVGGSSANAPEEVWEYVDAVIDLPVKKRELRSRIGNLVGRRRTAVELAERKTELEETVADLRLKERALDEAPAGLVITDPDRDDNPVVYANRQFETLTGYDGSEVVGRNCRFLQGAGTDPETRGRLRDAIEARQPVSVDIRNYRKDGQEFWNRLDVSPVRDDDGVVTNFVGFQSDVTERKRRERAVEALHDSMREMIQAADHERIAETAITATKTVLDEPICGIWLYEEEDDRLRPAAATDDAVELFDGIPAFDADGDSLAWRAFRANETRTYDDVTTADDVHNPDTPARSEIIAPLADYGVLTIGSTDPGAFTEVDRSLVTLLATNTEVALERASNERELSRQNDRLEFLTSLLRHDILNGMTVIQGQTDMLADKADEDVERHVETIRAWNTDIVELVQHVRAMLDTLTGGRRETIGPTDLSATLGDELDRVRRSHPGVEFEADVPSGVTVTANEFLHEVLGNVITNAVDHNDSEDPRVEVTVDAGPDRVQVRVADNGPGVPDERKETVFRRDETGHAKSSGSGFGLFFVDTMVSEYGGDVWIEDDHPTGSVVVMELPTQ